MTVLKTTSTELERRRRIRLSVFAYAYEFKNVSLVSDDEFDRLSRVIDLRKRTGNKSMDRFFRAHFSPDTGMWIQSHPELEKLDWLYETYYKDGL